MASITSARTSQTKDSTEFPRKPGDKTSTDSLRCENSIESVVEARVVPELIQHLAENTETSPPVALGEEHIEALAQLSLSEADTGPLAAYFTAMRAHGFPLETLYIDLLAPTARRLGEYWVEDLCSFAEVTLALCRLQQLMRDSAPDFWAEEKHAAHGASILMLPVCGEQHSFGVGMACEFFRRAGWAVWNLSGSSIADVIDMVDKQWFDILGLSLSAEVGLKTLQQDITTIRERSQNKDIGILVGGPAFMEHPEWVAQVGADAIAKDGREAVILAESLCAKFPNNSISA